MKALVAIKKVIDHSMKIEIKSNKIDINEKNMKMSINPFDEIAIEEAIRLKEKGKINKIIAITCGSKKNKDILRTSMAMGVDESILINTNNLILKPIIIAKLLKIIIEKEKPKIVLLGKQSIDNEYYQIGQILSTLLMWPQGICVSNIKFIKKNEIIIKREIDNGIEKLLLKIPAIISVDLRLNEPRYITLSNILKSKKKKNIKFVNIEYIIKKIKKEIQNF